MKRVSPLLHAPSLLIGGILVVVLLALSGLVLSVPSASSAYHPLADVSISDTDLGSVDPDGDGAINYIQDNVVTTTKILDGAITSNHLAPNSVTSSSIDPSQVQSRVASGCTSTSNAISQINSDGTVSCDTDNGTGFVTVAVTVTDSSATFTHGAQTACTNPSYPTMVSCSFDYTITSLSGSIKSISSTIQQMSSVPTCVVAITTAATATLSTTAKATCTN